MYSAQEVGEFRDTFRGITNGILKSFSYVTDKESFGQAELWSGLRLEHGRLWGDCEDLAIEVLNRCYDAGTPLDTMYMHYVQIPNVGGHAVAECCGLIADCNQASAVWRSSLAYYDWISHRRLDWSSPRAS